MTIGKTAALTLGFIGAVALGVVIGPTVRKALPHSDSATRVTDTAARTTEAAPAAEKAPAPSKKARPSTPRAKANAPATDTAVANADTSTANHAVSLSEPRLHDKLKPVLNRGARMDLAAAGFRNAEEFATVAHLARNANVPFMVLKHKVVDEHRSLADALHEAKPDVDAKAEVARAQAAARSDLAAVTS